MTQTMMEMCKNVFVGSVCEIKDFIRRLLLNAEARGLVYNGAFGAHNEPCTYWIVGDCIVTYLTDDEDFNATMLSDDMMDELIIEER